MRYKMSHGKNNINDENNQHKTALGEVRKKLNHKLAAVFFFFVTIGTGTFLVSKFKADKEKQVTMNIQKNRQAIKDYWQEIFPTADEFISNEKEDIYAAVYRIPEDVQKDLAVECDYVNQTRRNIEKRLKMLQEAKGLSAKGFRPILTASEQREYVVLEKTLKKLPVIDENHKFLARYGNLIKMVDFNEPLDRNYGAYNYDERNACCTEYRTAMEGGGGQYVTPFTFGEAAKRDFNNDEEYRQNAMDGKKATDFAVEATKNMQTMMKNIEKELNRIGLNQYLGKRNPDIVVTQRNIDFNQPDYWEKMGMGDKDADHHITYRTESNPFLLR